MIIVKLHQDPDLCRQVNRILIEAGVRSGTGNGIEIDAIYGAYRITGRAGNVVNRAYNADFYRDDGGYREYTHLDARTQMDQVRGFFGVAEPAPAQPVAPNWEKIVVVFNQEPDLVAQLKTQCERNGFRWNIPEGVWDRVGTIGIRREPFATIGYNGNNLTPEWWNENYSAGGIFHILKAATEMNQIIAWLERNSPNKTETKQMEETKPTSSKPDKNKQPPTKFVIHIAEQKHGAEIQELAIAAGYFLHPTQRHTRYAAGQFRSYMSLGAYDAGHGADLDRRVIIHDSRRSSFQSDAKDFNSAVDMPEIKAAIEAVRVWASEGVKGLPAEKFVGVNLLNMIKTNPKAEMVRGFIRKELKIKLPESVQAEGADAILKFLSENIKHVVDWPKPEPGANDPVDIEFEVDEETLARRVRTDTVTLRARVPGNIIQKARSEADPYVITRWLEEDTKWGDLLEIRRVNGEEGEPIEDAHDSWGGLTDEDALAEQISEKLNLE